MWFIYMLLGLYMLVPVLSPWLVQCSKQELQGYLGVWAFTTCLPYIHLCFPEVLGECFWNPSPMLHYFTGFVGYFVLGYYIKRYGALSIRTSLWMLIGAYLFTVAVYQYRLGKVTLVSDLEVCWRFCGVNIAIMAYAVFSLVSNIRWQGTGILGRWISQVSSLSYAIYFVHLMMIFFWRDAFSEALGHVYLQIPILTLGAFLSSYLVIWVLSKLPKAKVWLGV
jgi:surface polysaccharide O-acyltransferase-like enzyme